VRFSIDGISPFMVFDRVPAMPMQRAAAGALLRLGSASPDCGVLADHGHRAPPFWASLALGPDALRAYRLSKIGSILLLAALGCGIDGHRMFNDFNNSATSSTPTSVSPRCSAFWRSVGSAFIAWNLWTV